MKRIQYLLLTLIVLTTFFGCNNIGNTDNPLFGKEYRNAHELPEFKGYMELGGSVIESSKDKEGNYKLGFTYLQKDDKHVLILEEISKPNEKGEVRYKILDTIYVANAKENQYMTYGNCQQGEEWNDALVAFVTKTDADDTVIKVWLVDTKTGKIKPLADTKGIVCFGDEGCGEEEYEEIEMPAMPKDTTSLPVNDDTLTAQPADSMSSNE